MPVPEGSVHVGYASKSREFYLTVILTDHFWTEKYMYEKEKKNTC